MINKINIIIRYYHFANLSRLVSRFISSRRYQESYDNFLTTFTFTCVSSLRDADKLMRFDGANETHLTLSLSTLLLRSWLTVNKLKDCCQAKRRNTHDEVPSTMVILL